MSSSTELKTSETITDFLAWVDSFLNFEKLPQKNIFWLNMMQFLCERLGNPQNEIKCYHVAGSKGKGSVCAMISSILTAHGEKVGVYASPHIEDFRERIRLNDKFFTDEVYEKAAKELYEKFNSIKDELPKERVVTWFELVTVYAFLCMKAARVDEAVYEVGLGGRLDATNIVNPQICIINTIELEHTEFLGDTLEKIAAEKGGIIKNGIPVLCASQVDEVKAVFEKIAKEKNAPIVFADEILDSVETSYCNDDSSKANSANSDKLMSVEIKSKLFSRPLKYETKMYGEFQARNAFLAAAAVKMIHPEISEETIEKGLSKVTLPARFEIVERGTDCGGASSTNEIVIDGAHTVKSITLTMQTFEQFYKGRKANLLFACAADKDVEHIAKCFSGRFDKVVLTRPGLTKSCNADKMEKAFADALINFEYNEDFENAIKGIIAESKKEDAVLLITGSFYLASEVKKVLSEN